MVANIGPAYYTDREEREVAYYSLDVEIPVGEATAGERGDRSWMVLFRRDLKISELPHGFEKIEISEVVSYDSAARIVRFKIGAHEYEYRLPAP